MEWSGSAATPGSPPPWLAVAGSIGSALSGLTLLAAGVGYVVRTRASRAEDRRLFAQRIDALMASLAQLSPLLATWVGDQSVSAAAIQQRFESAVGNLMGLESEARGVRMRRVAEEVEGILSAFAIHLSAFGSDQSSRAELQREFDDVAHYLLRTRHILLTSRDDPVVVLRDVGIRRAPDMDAVFGGTYDMAGWQRMRGEPSPRARAPGHRGNGRRPSVDDAAGASGSPFGARRGGSTDDDALGAG